MIIGLLVNRTKRRQGEAEATLVADISSKFVNLPSGEVDREIMAAQRRICELLGLDFSTLWQWSDGAPGFFTLTHFYSARDGPQPPERMNQDQYPWARQQMLAGRIIKVSSLDELPIEAACDRETLRQFGIKSNLAIPLAVGGGQALGLLGLGTMQAERDWPDALVKRLQVVAQIFANALARKHADQALRESEERMTLAAEAAEFGVWAWSITRNEVWGSERWLRLFGFVAGETVNFHKILERIHPDDRATVEREVRHALVSGIDYAGEFRAVLPDGSQHWIASRGRGYPDANGTPTRMLGAARDSSERRLAEMETRELRGHLAHADRVTLLGQLASALAHELSQPLGAILRNAEAAEMILQTPAPDLDELRAIVTDILSDDQRAGHVIERLRSLLKRRSLDPQPINLQAVIAEVLALVHADAAARQVKLAFAATPALHMVLGDRVHLQQVLLNLLVNAMDALDACNPDQRSIQVVAHRTDVATVEVRVSDNGPGLPGDSPERWFEPFFTTKPNGMGMGLPVSRTIIEAHQGKLWAEHGPQGGACFCFTVPVVGGEVDN
ncbi:MAG: ATP-binding protein [Verrucomicrobia bacterium]|nr:ATP-binding protein [Verrucomicrobiota bacterium]